MLSYCSLSNIAVLYTTLSCSRNTLQKAVQLSIQHLICPTASLTPSGVKRSSQACRKRSSTGSRSRSNVLRIDDGSGLRDGALLGIVLTSTPHHRRVRSLSTASRSTHSAGPVSSSAVSVSSRPRATYSSTARTSYRRSRRRRTRSRTRQMPANFSLIGSEVGSDVEKHDGRWMHVGLALTRLSWRTSARASG